MKTLDTIRSRRSVRTFDGKALRQEDANQITALCEKVTSPYDIPITWKLIDAKQTGVSSPVIVGTDTFIAGKLRRVPHAEEAFGYAFEQIVLFAESLGVGTTWIAGTMDRKAFEKAIELSDGEVMPCVSPLGYPAKKMSLRETMMRKGVKADSRLGFGELFFDRSFEKPLTQEKAGAFAQVLEAVRFAPSAVNKQPWRIVLCNGMAHFYEKHSRGYGADGWDIQKIDMGIALYHFDMAAKELGLTASFEISDPGLTAPDDTEYIASFRLGE